MVCQIVYHQKYTSHCAVETFVETHACKLLVSYFDRAFRSSRRRRGRSLFLLGSEGIVGLCVNCRRRCRERRAEGKSSYLCSSRDGLYHFRATYLVSTTFRGQVLGILGGVFLAVGEGNMINLASEGTLRAWSGGQFCRMLSKAMRGSHAIH